MSLLFWTEWGKLSAEMFRNIIIRSTCCNPRMRVKCISAINRILWWKYLHHCPICVLQWYTISTIFKGSNWDSFPPSFHIDKLWWDHTQWDHVSFFSYSSCVANNCVEKLTIPDLKPRWIEVIFATNTNTISSCFAIKFKLVTTQVVRQHNIGVVGIVGTYESVLGGKHGSGVQSVAPDLGGIYCAAT